MSDEIKPLQAVVVRQGHYAGSTHMTPAEESNRQRLIEAEAKLAQRERAEPVAWMYRMWLSPDYEWEKGTYSSTYTVSLHEPSNCMDLTPLYTTPQRQESAEPVTLPSKLAVLNRPEGHPQQSEEELDKERQFASGWNAAIEEVEKLGNLFTAQPTASARR